jgi:AraC-like DNA-binding protein
MKVVPFQVTQTTSQAFRFQKDSLPYFYDQLHQHAEWQIMLILKGEGTLVAGDYIGRFGTGDVFVIGSNQPHVFRNDEAYYHLKKKNQAQSISIYFNEKYWGSTFWQIEEMKPVRKFLSKAQRGLKISGSTKSVVTEQILAIQNQKETKRLSQFFLLLDTLHHAKDIQPLSVSVEIGKSMGEEKRMTDVVHFTFNQSHRKIYLSEAAAIANLSVEAFCRYFKARTRKTYTYFLNEVRVSQACQLLSNTEKSIQTICYEAGFENVSNFNRVFKKVVGRPPSKYLK